MKDGSTPKEDRIRLWADKGYQGTDKDLPGANLMITHKRSKNRRTLTDKQREHSNLVNSTRILVEHYIGRLKHYACLTDPYGWIIGQFSDEFNVITGLVNLHLPWDRIDKGSLSLAGGRRSLTETGPPHLQAVPRSDDMTVHATVPKWCARIVANLCKTHSTPCALVKN